MSLPEHCANHAPVPWAEMSERAVRRARRRAARAVLSAGLEVRDARRRDDEDAYRVALGRLEDARARWQELHEGGGA